MHTRSMARLPISTLYSAPALPPGLSIPSAADILRDHVDLKKSHDYFAIPRDDPVLFGKYGRPIDLTEIHAQVAAHRGLLEIKSAVRAPQLYLAFKCSYTTVLIMEYIPGRTAKEVIEDGEKAGNAKETRDMAREKMALAYSELLRIPVPQNSPPRGIDGGLIQHVIFLDGKAFRLYQNVEELELHLNLMLDQAKHTRGKYQVQRLADEPMVFCYSDIYGGNFIIGDDGRVAVVDFAYVSILPSSFAKYAVVADRWNLELRELVTVPAAEGADNCGAPCALYGLLQMRARLFSEYGKENVPGGDPETQERLKRSILIRVP